MASVLQSPRLAAAGRRLGEPVASLAAAERARLEAAERAAYERGRREGAAAAAAEAEAAQARLATALDGALRQVVEATDAAVASHAERVVALAIEVAEALVDRLGGVSVPSLTARILAAVDHLDEPALTVRVHPDLAHLLAPALGDRGGRRIEIVSDFNVELGDALVAGEWGRAELTRRAFLDSVRDVLAAADA